MKNNNKKNNKKNKKKEEEEDKNAASLDLPPAVPVASLAARRHLTDIQRDGVDFMLSRLKDPLVAGGLLCDDTRLGKTTEVLETWRRDLQARAAAAARIVTPPRGQPSLVVMPKSAIGVWCKELQQHLGLTPVRGVPTLDTAARGVVVAVIVMETLDDVLHTADLALRCDLVLTTYSSLTMLQRHGARDALAALRYRFVFCDEAHQMVNEQTLVHTVLATRVHADAKWFVSATPMQNKPTTDLTTALHFIGVPPEQLTTPEQLQHWLRRVYIRRERVGSQQQQQQQQQQQHGHGMALPQTLLEFATSNEARLYAHTTHAMAVVLRNGGHSGRRSLQTIHRLRRLCVAPYLIGHDALRAGDDLSPPLPAGMELAPDAAASKEPWLDHQARMLAARGLRDLALTQNPEIATEVSVRAQEQLRRMDRMDVWPALSARVESMAAAMLQPVSTKEQWVCATLLNQQLDPSGEKVVIFSNWKEPLERLAELFTLRRTALKRWLPRAREHVYVNGDQSPDQRNALVERFQKDPDVGYLLVTMQCGGIAQEFTAANHVVLLDPWWNPQTEFQAKSRIEGPNQQRPTHVYRLILRNTIDENVVAYAEHKRQTSAALTALHQQPHVVPAREQYMLLADALHLGEQPGSPMSIDESI